MKVNKKTVQRFFTVSGVAAAVFCLLVAITPLSFAVISLPVDSSNPTVTSYQYGSNSGIIDFYRSDGKYFRYIVNNNFSYVYLHDNSNGTIELVLNTLNGTYNDFYFAEITGYNGSSPVFGSYSRGIIASNGTGNTLGTWSTQGTVRFVYVRTSGISVETSGVSNNRRLEQCDFNCYYPFINTGSGQVSNGIDRVISNQAAESSAAQSRYEANQSADNSRQSEIMNAGSDVTVSTIDNWVNGNNGLAGKLTELAATLSSNAAIFSQNQVSNQENLSRAGNFVNDVFSELPTGIIAACICFLIILICVKVVGR